MPPSPYMLKLPRARSTSVVFSSPHSGRDYPAAFLKASMLDEWSIRSSEDAFVDELFGAAPEFGAPLLAATTPRAFIDVNRSAEELDPALVEGAPRSAHNPRISSGLGVIPRVVANGRVIYRGKISRADADARIAAHWQPYHATLRGLVEEALAAFGEAILIDCHSMPHEAIEQVSAPGARRPDVVLGDRFGAAAAVEVVERIEAAFAGAGLRVARNAPFAGAYIAQAYGRPSRGTHVVQVEIDRALYMDERTVAPGPDFEAFRALMTSVVAELAAIGRGGAALPLAAE
ncbi:MAG: N-formylglutamate amidohydrolase [Paracoccaceae bacterium]|nr:N-formylglutamate amidohydrolase [Paracoccaceae bacterium]